MYEIQSVTPTTAALYARLTSPRFRGLLTQEKQDSIVAAAVSYCGQPVGLCLVETSEDGQIGAIRSLFVATRWQNIGLGRELLLYAEEKLREKGCQKFTTSFATEQNLTMPIQSLLQRCRWEEPDLDMEENNIDLCALAKENWIYSCRLPASYKRTPWPQAGPEELAELKKQTWYPDYASPFMKHPKNIHLPTSFWLQRGEEIVGWGITREMKNQPDTIHYGTIFIKEELRLFTGCGIPFLAENLKVLFETRIPYLNYIFFREASGRSNANLIRFLERCINQFSTKTRKTWKASKNIG